LVIQFEEARALRLDKIRRLALVQGQVAHVDQLSRAATSSFSVLSTEFDAKNRFSKWSFKLIMKEGSKEFMCATNLQYKYLSGPDELLAACNSLILEVTVDVTASMGWQGLVVCCCPPDLLHLCAPGRGVSLIYFGGLKI
jgi:hypothetical protein